IFTQFEQNIDHIVSWSKQALPRDYASFAPLIFQHAHEDHLAKQLLLDTARDIEMLLDALLNKGAERVALMGSIGRYIQPWLQERYRERLQVPRFDAVDGAIFYARQHLPAVETVTSETSQ
ncbi:MAG: hypothetical protein ACRCR6_09395, partial [Plesiomonas sp.]